MTYVTTQSYVAFMRMTSLASLLLFEYLEARKLEDASALGAAGGSSSLLHGFRMFVRSSAHLPGSKRVFSLTPADVPARRSLLTVLEGLMCLSRLSASAWETQVANGGDSRFTEDAERKSAAAEEIRLLVIDHEFSKNQTLLHLCKMAARSFPCTHGPEEGPSLAHMVLRKTYRLEKPDALRCISAICLGGPSRQDAEEV